MSSTRGYVSSYTLTDESKELFQIDLLKQMGFYQISEFTSPSGESPFIIEQTNRVGTPKVAAFDKETGQMLGAFKTNSLIDSAEELVFKVCRMSELNDPELVSEFGNSDDDYVAVSLDGQTPIALFISLPKHHHKDGLFTRLKAIANQIGKSGHNVLQLVILEPKVCDPRMLYAVAVILHNRGGLQLNAKINP